MFHNASIAAASHVRPDGDSLFVFAPTRLTLPISAAAAAQTLLDRRGAKSFASGGAPLIENALPTEFVGSQTVHGSQKPKRGMLRDLQDLLADQQSAADGGVREQIDAVMRNERGKRRRGDEADARNVYTRRAKARQTKWKWVPCAWSGGANAVGDGHVDAQLHYASVGTWCLDNEGVLGSHPSPTDSLRATNSHCGVLTFTDQEYTELNLDAACQPEAATDASGHATCLTFSRDATRHLFASVGEFGEQFFVIADRWSGRQHPLGLEPVAWEPPLARSLKTALPWALSLRYYAVSNAMLRSRLAKLSTVTQRLRGVGAANADWAAVFHDVLATHPLLVETAAVDDAIPSVGDDASRTSQRDGNVSSVAASARPVEAVDIRTASLSALVRRSDAISETIDRESRVNVFEQIREHELAETRAPLEAALRKARDCEAAYDVLESVDRWMLQLELAVEGRRLLLRPSPPPFRTAEVTLVDFAKADDLLAKELECALERELDDVLTVSSTAVSQRVDAIRMLLGGNVLLLRAVRHREATSKELLRCTKRLRELQSLKSDASTA